MAFSFQPDPSRLPYNQAVFDTLPGAAFDRHRDYFTLWCVWAERNGLNLAEFGVPLLVADTEIRPFLAEQRFTREHRPEPSSRSVESLGPWDYLLQLGNVWTRSKRHDEDFLYHRYRASLLVGTAAAIAGPTRTAMSVLDVACHCGAFAIEFAEAGFGRVSGFDLRRRNIAQANFLADIFGTRRVDFSVANARDVRQFGAADIVFCGGLLYHLTFPMELLAGLHAITGEFLILDSLCHNHPFSGFHLVCQKNVDYSAEGETHYELQPTYRAIIDGLHAVGFKWVIELAGSGAADVPGYRTGNVRSFIAAKRDDGVFGAFMRAAGFVS